MKSIYVIFCILLPCFCFADAGFNITRPKAPCYAVFKGIDKMPEFEFYKIAARDERKEIVLDSTLLLKENDSLRIYYGEGERKYWQGPIKILARNKSTGQVVDSFVLVADGNNLTINFAGIENNKPGHTITKTKSEYPYTLFGDEDVDTAVARRNKYILIAMSATGFLLLFFMISKRRKNKISEPA
jgi:hypothetical protein